MSTHACKTAKFSEFNLEMLSNACRPYDFLKEENRFPAFACPTLNLNGAKPYDIIRVKERRHSFSVFPDI